MVCALPPSLRLGDGQTLQMHDGHLPTCRGPHTINTGNCSAASRVLGKYMASSNMHFNCIMDDLRLSTNPERPNGS